MKRVLLIFSLTLGFLIPISSPAEAIFGLGCSEVQKKIVPVKNKMAKAALAEVNYFKKYDYRTAYQNYALASKYYKQWYDMLKNKRSCFKNDASIDSTIKSMHSGYYVQKSMCDRYGLDICTRFIKTTDPCAEYKYSVFDYQNCMEDQARPTDSGYVD